MEVFLLTLFIVDWHVQIIFASVLLLFEEQEAVRNHLEVEGISYFLLRYLFRFHRNLNRKERNISKVRETRKILAILYEVNEE